MRIHGLFLLSLACATTQAPPTQKVEMEPVMVRAAADPLTGLDGYDASQLFEVANNEYKQGAADRALSVYELLLKTFPDSELVPETHFNIGLCYEKLEEVEKALGKFQGILSAYPGHKIYKDAYFRSAFALAKLQRWPEATDHFWQIRQLPQLTSMDELEARVAQGVGMFMQDDFATAEKEFMSALRFYEERSKGEYLPAEYWVGQSRFYLGEIYAREFEKVVLSPPSGDHDNWVKLMGGELEEKCELLMRAQNNFIRTIRAGHTGWATAAGFRIGALYERLYDDLMGVPVPPDLDTDTAQFYREELKNRVGVLVVKAIKVYEMSLQMAERVGENNEWVERTQKSLERMKSLYLSAFSG